VVVFGAGTSAAEWREIGADRGEDARTLWSAKRLLAATYLQWYAVECLAKALVVASGRKPPTSGSAGHDIGMILEMAGLPRKAVPVDLRKHYERRSVAMRYEREGSRDFGAEYTAAVRMASLLARQVGRRSLSPRHGSRKRGGAR
jgi:hypothetical protein